ncbi:MAG: phenylalanine--tRNA ligase subunit beta [Pirellulaceae bacterium]|nr:phenylalanine--tRNA ligase subunit beta [Pirellulaceae bacterium]
MLISWEWLSQYVKLSVKPDELATRFAMSGLNHESTIQFGDDTVIDLEVTSNRGDCLGHIGVAREASVLLNQTLSIPTPSIAKEQMLSQSIRSLLSIENQFIDGCPRYIGRIIRGVKIGPSPDWLQRRLAAICIKSVNNVVDVTNYVMFESGQPLHAFDLAKIQGQKMVVRPALPKEKFVAIDHRTYELDPSMIVIADANRGLAIGGVMGGVDSEVSADTVDLVIESAAFTPLTIRRCARKLRLHSPSSFRFERRVDQAGLYWASQRCCQLILEVAGGQCTGDSIDTGADPSAWPSIVLRKDRISKVIGIEIPWEQSVDILRHLGCIVQASPEQQGSRAVQITPPSFRRDLTREIDLIEEIARIYGYEKIPEDAVVPIAVSAKRPKDVLLERVRSVVTASGLDEALTPSVVAKPVGMFASQWTDLPPLQTKVHLLEGATYLRRSLVPSLLQAYQLNQSQQQRDVSLFETAVIYLPADKGSTLPREQSTLGWVSVGELRSSVGMIEEIISRVVGYHRATQRTRTLEPISSSELTEGSSIWHSISGKRLAWVGQLSRSVRDSLKIDAELCVGELNLDLLLEQLELVPALEPLVTFPAIHRDLNLIVDEAIQWSNLSATVHQSAGTLLSECLYRETYRDPKKDGEGKKRILLTLVIQSRQQTLTSEQADGVVQKVIEATSKTIDAKLLA